MQLQTFLQNLIDYETDSEDQFETSYYPEKPFDNDDDYDYYQNSPIEKDFDKGQSFETIYYPERLFEDDYEDDNEQPFDVVYNPERPFDDYYENVEKEMSPLVPTNDMYETLESFLEILGNESVSLFSYTTTSSNIMNYTRQFILSECANVLSKHLSDDEISRIEQYIFENSEMFYDYIHSMVSIVMLFSRNITFGYNNKLEEDGYRRILPTVMDNGDVVNLLFEKTRISHKLKNLIMYEVQVHINILTLSLFTSLYNELYETDIIGPIIEYSFGNLKHLENQSKWTAFKCINCQKNINTGIKSIVGVDTVLFCSLNCIKTYNFRN